MLAASALQKKGSETSSDTESTGAVGELVCGVDGDNAGSSRRTNRSLGGSRGDLSGSGQDGGRGRGGDNHGGAVGVGRVGHRGVARRAVGGGGDRGRLRVDDSAGAVGDGDGRRLSHGVGDVLVSPSGRGRAVGGVLRDNDGGPDSLLSLGESQQAGEGDKLRQSHGDGLSRDDAVMSERG